MEYGQRRKMMEGKKTWSFLSLILQQ